MTIEKLPSAGEIVAKKQFIHSTPSGEIYLLDSISEGYFHFIGEAEVSFVMPEQRTESQKVASLKSEIERLDLAKKRAEIDLNTAIALESEQIKC